MVDTRPRFVGWVTNFIVQRHRPSVSMVNAISRHTFARRMDPDTRAAIHRRTVDHGIKAAGSFMGYAVRMLVSV